MVEDSKANEAASPSVAGGGCPQRNEETSGSIGKRTILPLSFCLAGLSPRLGSSFSHCAFPSCAAQQPQNQNHQARETQQRKTATNVCVARLAQIAPTRRRLLILAPGNAHIR